MSVLARHVVFLRLQDASDTSSFVLASDTFGHAAMILSQLAIIA